MRFGRRGTGHRFQTTWLDPCRSTARRVRLQQRGDNR